MRDRRQVGLVDHSDQRDREEKLRCEGGAYPPAYLSLQQAHASEMPRSLHTLARPERLGRHALLYLLKQLLKGQLISDVIVTQASHPQPRTCLQHYRHSSASEVNSSILMHNRNSRVRLSVRVKRTARVTSNQRTIDRHVLRISPLGLR
jgi:hypothetical protein